MRYTVVAIGSHVYPLSWFIGGLMVFAAVILALTLAKTVRSAILTPDNDQLSWVRRR